MSFRQAMKVQHSRMEMDVLEDLATQGLHPMTAKSFPVLSTTPDYWFPDKRVAVYLDGKKVHFKRQDKDARLRYLLKKRHRIRVLSITYDGNSKRERRRIVEEIKQFLEEQ